MRLVHNERTKLLATALNTTGVGAILAGIVAPAANGTLGDPSHIIAWVGLGLDLILMAQAALGRLLE